MKSRPLTLALMAIGLISANVYATSMPLSRVLVAPLCLTSSVTIPFSTIASDKTLTLIEVDDAMIPALADAKHQTKSPCGGFMDVTAEWQAYRTPSMLANGGAKQFLASFHMEKNQRSTGANNYQIRYIPETTALMSKMDANRMWADLTTLTSFKNRNANTEYGVKAAEWIKTQVAEMAKQYGRDDVSIRLVPTPGYKQPSIVAKIGTSNEPGIVIGGHMDTTSSSDRQPGADDDGSGSVTVLEVTRSLLSSDVRFKKPIYVMWYAAEEAGLVGSQYVVRDFKEKKIPVSEVLHLDMTGFPDSQNPSAIWLIGDYVNKDLTNYLKKLITTYLNQPVEMTACGYACSDHASWTRGGFKSAMPSESSFERSNHSIHTTRDTMDKLSLQHMSDYAKLGIAFAVELAEPVSAK